MAYGKFGTTNFGGLIDRLTSKEQENDGISYYFFIILNDIEFNGVYIERWFTIARVNQRSGSEITLVFDAKHLDVC